MWITSRYWLAFGLFCGVLWLGGCAPAAWQPRPGGDLVLESGRYLDRYYRRPDFDAVTAIYRVEVFPVEQVNGISMAQAESLFQEELSNAMAANGLRLYQDAPQESRGPAADRINPSGASATLPTGPKKPLPDLILSGEVHRLALAAPSWRFLSGRGRAHLRVSGQIRRDQEVVFAFQDEVSINPPVNPRHRPPLESDLLARMIIRRFPANLVNELLLPPQP